MHTESTTMNRIRTFLPLTLIALAVLSACNTAPVANARLEEARSEYRIAQDNPQSRDMAAAELKQAGDALKKADAAWADKQDTEDVNHLAYIARQRVAIAQEAGRQKAAELAVTNANAERDKLRLAARTSEVASAQQSAQTAGLQADASKAQADVAKQQATDAQARSAQLEAQLKDLDAKKTDRGMVVTLGDVLFDSNRTELKSAGMRSVDKLAGFLKQNPQRKVLIEGYTDSVGSEGTNQDLSTRRADAVRTAMVGQGVGVERMATQGYGEARPVASNGTADGRSMNRRVEVILSDEAGLIAPR